MKSGNTIIKVPLVLLHESVLSNSPYRSTIGYNVVEFEQIANVM